MLTATSTFRSVSTQWAAVRLPPLLSDLMELELSADGLRILVSDHSPYDPAATATVVDHDITYELDTAYRPSRRHRVQVIDRAGNSESGTRQSTIATFPTGSSRSRESRWMARPRAARGARRHSWAEEIAPIAAPYGSSVDLLEMANTSTS